MQGRPADGERKRVPRLVTRSARLVLLFEFAAGGFAQTSAVSAALEGYVLDPLAAHVPGATISVRNTETHLAREVSSNAEGAYRIAGLPAGTYEVEVRYPGFQPFRHAGVALPLGSTVHLDAILTLAGADTITVTAQPPALDAAQTSVATSVDTERIEELPREPQLSQLRVAGPGCDGIRPAIGAAGRGFRAGQWLHFRRAARAEQQRRHRWTGQ
jgi:hypothetical protein